MKRKLLSIILALALVLTLVAVPAYGAEPLSYVAFGDSIAAGTAQPGYAGLYSTPKTAFPTLVAKALGAKLTDLAINGLDSTELLDLVTNDASYISAIEGADVISITIGSNDVGTIALIMFLEALGAEDIEDPAALELFLREKIGSGTVEDTLATIKLMNDYIFKPENKAKILAGLDAFRSNWGKLIGRIEELNSDVDIIVTGYYNPYKVFEIPGITTIGSFADEMLAELTEWIERDEFKGRYTIVDVHDIESNMSVDLEDLSNSYLDIHPSTFGHAQFAERIVKTYNGLKGTDYAVSLLPFTDVSTGAWYYEDVLSMYQGGIVYGLTDTSFGPDAKVTAKQFITLLYRLAGSPAVDYTVLGGLVPAALLAEKPYYLDAAVWGAGTGLISSLSDLEGVFTREKLCLMMFKYLGTKGGDTGAAAELPAYDDAANISEEAKAAVAWSAANDIMVGSDNKFLPLDEVKRSEAVALLNRAANYKAPEGAEQDAFFSQDVSITVMGMTLKMSFIVNEAMDHFWIKLNFAGQDYELEGNMKIENGKPVFELTKDPTGGLAAQYLDMLNLTDNWLPYTGELSA